MSKHVGVAFCNFYDYCNRHLCAFVGGIKNNKKLLGTTIKEVTLYFPHIASYKWLCQRKQLTPHYVKIKVSFFARRTFSKLFSIVSFIKRLRAPSIIRKQDKSRITSADMKFMSSSKYIWQDYRTNEYNLSEIKTNPVVNKIQNYKSKWIQRIRWMDTDRL